MPETSKGRMKSVVIIGSIVLLVLGIIIGLTILIIYLTDRNLYNTIFNIKPDVTVAPATTTPTASEIVTQPPQIIPLPPINTSLNVKYNSLDSTYSLYNGVDVVGDTYANMQSNVPQICINSCSNNNECVGFTYDKSECKFYNSITNIVSDIPGQNSSYGKDLIIKNKSFTNNPSLSPILNDTLLPQYENYVGFRYAKYNDNTDGTITEYTNSPNVNDCLTTCNSMLTQCNSVSYTTDTRNIPKCRIHSKFVMPSTNAIDKQTSVIKSDNMQDIMYIKNNIDQNYDMYDKNVRLYPATTCIPIPSVSADPATGNTPTPTIGDANKTCSSFFGTTWENNGSRIHGNCDPDKIDIRCKRTNSNNYGFSNDYINSNYRSFVSVGDSFILPNIIVNTNDSDSTIVDTTKNLKSCYTDCNLNTNCAGSTYNLSNNHCTSYNNRILVKKIIQDKNDNVNLSFIKKDKIVYGD